MAGRRGIRLVAEVLAGERPGVASVVGEDSDSAVRACGEPVAHLSDRGVRRKGTEALVDDVRRAELRGLFDRGACHRQARYQALDRYQSPRLSSMLAEAQLRTGADS